MEREEHESQQTTIQPRVIRPGEPVVETTFQLAARIDAEKQDPNEVRLSGVRIALEWLDRKFPLDFPEGAVSGEGFQLDVPGQSIECIDIPETGLWSLRLVQPDAPFYGREAVPGRNWTTDISFATRESSVAFGVRVSCASLEYSTEDITLTRPRVVVNLANDLGLRDVRPISDTPWTIDSVDALHELHSLLIDPNRNLPVIVLTQPDRQELPVPVSDYVLDDAELARKFQGLAYVVKLPWDIAFKWTEMVGKVWSVYRGAVRSYMPGLDFENDSPSSHPRALVDRIIFCRYKDMQAEEAFSALLANDIATHAATTRVRWDDRLFISDARTQAAEIARRRLLDDLQAKAKAEERVDSLETQIDSIRETFEEEVFALKEKIKELEKESEDYNDDAIRSEQAMQHYKEENDRLRWRVSDLHKKLTDKLGENPDESIGIPECYDDLPEWIEKNLTGRLVLHRRALRGLKNARYEDVSLVCQALLLLANEYRDMRMGAKSGKAIFKKRRKELHLKCDGAITKERAGEQGDTYYVRYPTVSSPRRLLEYHLRRGTARNEERCLRIYFFWDDDTRQVVVGWLPSHLDTRNT